MLAAILFPSLPSDYPDYRSISVCTHSMYKYGLLKSFTQEKETKTWGAGCKKEEEIEDRKEKRGKRRGRSGRIRTNI